VGGKRRPPPRHGCVLHPPARDPRRKGNNMKPRLMIVDDDPGVLKTVGLVLASQGYEVLKTPSGAACLESLRQGFHGVILMDIMMPGLSGWDTIRAMQAGDLLRDNLICMLTALPEPGPEGEDLQEVVFDYLPKPFTNRQLLDMVENALGFLAA
jgi:CheY-like chemotaxis protein